MVEIIGFIISLLALLYIFIKQSISPPQRQEDQLNNENEEFIEGDPFREFIRKVEKEAEREAAVKASPPPSLKITKKQKRAARNRLEEEDQIVNQIENRKLKSPLEERRFQSKLTPHVELPRHTLSLPKIHRDETYTIMKKSKGQLALKRLANRQDLIIYQEIINKPKSLRPEVPL